MITIYSKHYPPCTVKEKSKTEHYIGRELLARGLKELYGICIPTQRLDEHIEKAEHEKPFLKDYPHIHFNISHCDELVVCAFAPEIIGCDIERIVDFKDTILKRVLTTSEKEYLGTFQDNLEKRKEMFCRFWTLKESRIKHSGLGLSMPMTDFSFTFDFSKDPVQICCSDPDLYFYQLSLDENCFFSMCTAHKQPYRFIQTD